MDKAEELRYLFLAVQREGNRALTDALAPLDLTPAQAEVLQVLEQYGSLTLTELGERLVCETGSPSRLVSSMVEKGYVRKTTSEADRRANKLTLTAQARDLMPRLNQIERDFNRPPDFLDEATMDQAIKLLWLLAGDSISGKALQRRKNGD
ncbi:MAG TPA: MarR family transcriptional regulator [Phototrophicaceae bacterium]|nr:MarR family transcriptional regulator [Phototrophicaceae bacterium]